LGLPASSTNGFHFDDETVIGLVSRLLPAPLGHERKPDIGPRARNLETFDLGTKIRNVETTLQRWWQCCLDEVDQDTLALLAQIYAGSRVRKVDDDLCFAVPATAEIDIADCVPFTVALGSAKAVADSEVVVAAAAAAPCKVMTTVLPSTLVSYLTIFARLNTTRVRPPDCPSLMVRKSPWLTSCEFLPSPFAVAGKSNASRGGLFTVNAAGGLAGASLSPSLTVTNPAWLETSIDWMMLAGEAVPIYPDHK
jgi:hypothetical protein